MVTNNSISEVDFDNQIKELTGYEPVLGGKLTEKAVWVDESKCIGCRYCAHVATNTFIVDEISPSRREVRLIIRDNSDPPEMITIDDNHIDKEK